MTPTNDRSTLRIALPKGRMQEEVFALLGDAGIRVRTGLGSRSYRPSISLPNCEVKLLKPQNIIEMLHAGSRDVGSRGIHVQVSLPPPERLADLAHQLQEWEVEELAAAGRPATWPECPEHPDSHPLAPQARGGQAVWCCPASGQVISVVGSLRPG